MSQNSAPPHFFFFFYKIILCAEHSATRKSHAKIHSHLVITGNFSSAKTQQPQTLSVPFLWLLQLNPVRDTNTWALHRLRSSCCRATGPAERIWNLLCWSWGWKQGSRAQGPSQSSHGTDTAAWLEKLCSSSFWPAAVCHGLLPPDDNRVLLNPNQFGLLFHFS